MHLYYYYTSFLLHNYMTCTIIRWEMSYISSRHGRRHPPPQDGPIHTDADYVAAVWSHFHLADLCTMTYSHVGYFTTIVIPYLCMLVLY